MNRKTFKLALVTGAIALALGTQAQAFTPFVSTYTPTPPSSVNIYMSGGSAPSNMFRENIIQNNCDLTSNDVDVFMDIIKNAGALVPGSALPAPEHTNYWAVACHPKSAAGLTTTAYIVSKTDAGGSGNGTTPVVNKLQLGFMNVTSSCSLAVASQPIVGNITHNYRLWTCGSTGTSLQVPDMGVSDIEPSAFVGELAPASGDFPSVVPGNWKTAAGPGLIFGVIVTKNLRDTLQHMQFPGHEGDESSDYMPSLPSTVVQGLLDGKYSDWTQVTVNGQTIPATPWSGTLADTGINICRRVKGSGTHAQFMKQFNRTGCQSGTLSMIGEPGDGFGNTVYENSDAGVLDNCLAAINDGTSYTNAQVFFNGTHTVPGTGGAGGHYGIGYQSTEKNASLALNTRFIKIDGNAPIALNAFNGNYSDVYFQSINHRANEYVGGGTNIRAANLTGSANTDAEKIATHFFATSPATTAVINTAFKFGTGASAWQGGYLQPTEAVAAGTAYSAANPITQWVRTTPDYSAPDSCSPLSYWQ